MSFFAPAGCCVSLHLTQLGRSQLCVELGSPQQRLCTYWCIWGQLNNIEISTMKQTCRINESNVEAVSLQKRLHTLNGNIRPHFSCRIVVFLLQTNPNKLGLFFRSGRSANCKSPVKERCCSLSYCVEGNCCLILGSRRETRDSLCSACPTRVSVLENRSPVEGLQTSRHLPRDCCWFAAADNSTIAGPCIKCVSVNVHVAQKCRF